MAKIIMAIINMAKINSIDSKNSPQRLACLLAAGLVIGASLLQAAPKDAQPKQKRERALRKR